MKSNFMLRLEFHLLDMISYIYSTNNSKFKEKINLEIYYSVPHISVRGIQSRHTNFTFST